MEVKCKKCGYEWKTRSKLINVSCPSCNNKVKLREINNAQDKEAVNSMNAVKGEQDVQ